MRLTAVSGRLWALLALLLCLNVALAGVVRPIARQDASPTTNAAIFSSTSDVSTTAVDDASPSTTGPDTDATSSPSSTTASSTGTATTTTSIVSATPFVSNGPGIANTTTPGVLPIVPVRTPGYFVAAIVLMATGIILALFANWHHVLIYCILSVALCVAVGVTMIILLLKPGVVSNSLQGGFVAVVIIGGCIVGGCASLKPAACEPFGCLLGGFCFGMWMLTLRQSGLLGQDKTENGIFLSAMSILPVFFYFWRLTKHHTMMVASAFVGATALVLGIDFVSNAGLKEYWAWIWNLNDDLFPPDADTYPLKTGIKVEQGVTIVLFLVGVTSQWSRTKTNKQRQAKRELEKRAGHLAVQKADEKAGAEFERRIAAERLAFESSLLSPPGPTYQGKGSRMDKFLAPLKKGWKVLEDGGAVNDQEAGVGESRPEEARDVARADVKDRGVQRTSTGCDTIPEVKDQSRISVQTKHDSCHSIQGHHDSATTIPSTSTAPNERDLNSKEIGPSSPLRSTVTEERSVASNRTMPVEEDIEMHDLRPVAPIRPTAAEMVMGKDDEAGRVTVHVAVDEVELAAAARAARNPIPEVIPLPFKLPIAEDEEQFVDDDDEDYRSSLAVMADEFPDKEAHETQSIHSKRGSFARRLSTSSVELFRSMSQHSKSTHLTKRNLENTESTEDLNASRRGDRNSVAATCDDMSSVDENDLPAAASPTSEQRFSKEIKAKFADDNSHIRRKDLEAGEQAVGESSGESSALNAAVLAAVTDSRKGGDAAPDKIDTGASEPLTKEQDKTSGSAASDDDVGSGAGMSQAFVNSAVPQTLETGKLETRVSQAVQTYRMVDWVKHQTKADEPLVDNIDLPELRDLTRPRPVDVEDLVKTAENGAPRTAKPRTASAIHEWARKSSAQHLHAAHQSHLSPHHDHDRTANMTSEQTRQAEIQATVAALAGATVHHASSTPSQATTTAESLRSRPPVPGIKPHNCPQSLVAKRDTMMRMKEQALRPHSVRPISASGSSAQFPGETYGSVAALSPPSLPSDPNSPPSSQRASSAYHRSPNVSSARPTGDDDDDNIPMRVHQAIIRSRHKSMDSTPSSGHEAAGSSSEDYRAVSGPQQPPLEYFTSGGAGGGGGSSSVLPAVHNPNLPHPQRSSFDPHSAHKREAQLAGFRSSVQADRRASSQALPVTQPGYGGGYLSNTGSALMNGPLINSVYNTIPGTSSSHSLQPQQTSAWQADVSRDMELHRQSMMNAQKGAVDNRHRELRRAERKRQRQLRAVSGEALMDAHSESMLRLQKKANIQ